MEQQGSGKHMMALNTTTGKGGWKAFKGKCNKCGKQGHKARDCNTGHGETKNTNSNKTFSGKCFKCGDSGHMARDSKKTRLPTEKKVCLLVCLLEVLRCNTSSKRR